MTSPVAQVDLQSRARQALIEAGFHPDIPAEVKTEIEEMSKPVQADNASARDLRALLWSSIDNDSSRDLDQIEYVEELANGGTRLLVGIADVDSFVPKGSALDHRAGGEATSVYTGVATFPMLPVQLSTGLTSLLDAQDRLAMVIDMRILDSGEVSCHELYPALVRNHAKLAYGSTGAWLEGRGPMPPAIANTLGMEAQLRLQQATAEKLQGIRKQHGALAFGSNEAMPVIENGVPKDLKLSEHNVAEDIIESFMVAANVSVAEHLRQKRTLSLRRVVRTPRRWDRIVELAGRFGTKLPTVPDGPALSGFLEARKKADPEHFPDLSLSVVKLLGPGEYVAEVPGSAPQGHFGLAVHDYTHSTAPNRRFADLVSQRLVKAATASSPAPYAASELASIATHCTEREDAARKVERLMRKIIAANLLIKRIGEIFDGIVTGASPKGTYVRLLKFPAEGKVVRGEHGIDVGDRVRVKLAYVDVDKGFIDFEVVV